MTSLVLALGALLGQLGDDVDAPILPDANDCPVVGVETEAPEIMLADPPAWRLEALVAFQPDQPRDYPCNRGIDCLTATRSFVAGAVRGRYDVPEKWSLAATIDLGHNIDFEEVPVGGFTIMSLRVDFQLELGRARHRFGASLRVSPVVMLGWSDTGVAFRTDLPGFALLLGEADLWGEVIVPAFPTHMDPRLFYAGAGWRTGAYTLEGGFATYGSIGYRKDEIDRASNNIGLWAMGTWRIPDAHGQPTRWELSARLAIAYPFIMILGAAWRFDGG